MSDSNPIEPIDIAAGSALVRAFHAIVTGAEPHLLKAGDALGIRLLRVVSMITELGDIALGKLESLLPRTELRAPEPEVIGPLLEHGRWVADEHLQNMFLRLLASTFLPDHHVHPSYVAILRELSPLDARVIQVLWMNWRHELVVNSDGSITNSDAADNTTYFKEAADQSGLLAISLINVQRLRLSRDAGASNVLQLNEFGKAFCLSCLGESDGGG